MSADLRTIYRRVGVPGRIAVVVVLLAGVACAAPVPRLVKAVFAPSAKQVIKKNEEKDKQIADEYSKALAMQTAQFTGRSVFFIPSAPPPPVKPPEPVVEVKHEEPKAPPPPSVYGGPKLIAMVNDEAWFDDGQKLKAGADGKDGLKVKEVRAPWEVAVVWKETDFKVSLFEKDNVVWPVKKEPAKTEAVKTPEGAGAKEPAGDPKPGAKPDGAGEPKAGEPKPSDPKTPESKPVEPAPKPAEPMVEPAPDAPKPAAPSPTKPDDFIHEGNE